MNEPRFLLSGDDLDRRAERFRGAFQELVLVAGIPHRAGRDRAHGHHVQLLVGLRHPEESAACKFQGFASDSAIFEHTRPQPRHLAFRRQSFGGYAGAGLCGQHTDGVAADIDGGIARHMFHSTVTL